MTNDLEIARADAIAEIQARLSEASAAALKRHGGDPQSLQLLESGIARFIDKTEAALPGIGDRLAARINDRFGPNDPRRRGAS